jgi:mannan endo-1,4-beta-mannosidase
MKTGLNIRTINTAKYLTGILLSLFITASLSSIAFGSPASDPQASSKTQAVLDYITNLPNRSDNRVVSGQHTFMTDNLIENVHTDSGKYVGLVGIDYFYQNNSSTNNQVIAWSNANALISVVDHMNNPLTGGTAWDTTTVDLTQMITPGTTLNNTFKGVLDKIATGLTTLQSNNVVVLFRPFHEMNGDWFWWGNKNTTQFKNLWIYTFNYLTQTKGLHNLLWVWSSNADLTWTYYPGSQYVDIVGVDRYSALTVPKVAGYDQLSTYNKPFGLTEWGACGPAGGCSPMDISPLIASIKTNMPKTAFFMAWAEAFSLDYNTGTSKLLADPWVITRDEIAFSTIQPLAAPGGLRIVSAQ